MTTIPEPQTMNIFPRCVEMKLHIEAESASVKEPAADLNPFAPPSRSDTGNGKSPYPPLILSLTINFSGEQEIDIPGARVLGIPSGKATFGVRRCELRFTLKGYRLPLDQVTLSAPLKRSVTVETQRERATEAQAGVTLGGTVGEKTGGTASGTLGFKQADKLVEKVTTERFQVHYSGGEVEPMWVFEVKDGDTILQGALNGERLGTVFVGSALAKAFGQKVTVLPSFVTPPLTTTTTLSLPNQVEVNPTGGMRLLTNFLSVAAVLEVRPEDVRLTWGKVAWASNITRNRLALIERAIALKHIGPLLKDGLSTTRWQYGGH